MPTPTSPLPLVSPRLPVAAQDPTPFTVLDEAVLQQYAASPSCGSASLAVRAVVVDDQGLAIGFAMDLAQGSLADELDR